MLLISLLGMLFISLLPRYVADSCNKKVETIALLILSQVKPSQGNRVIM